MVGAGIIGTTAAFRLLKSFPDISLKIVADKLSPQTTSDIAAGWVEPHLDPDTCPERVKKWAAETYALCDALASGNNVDELSDDDLQKAISKAVIKMQGFDADDNESILNPPWSSIVANYKVLGKDEICGLYNGSSNLFGHAYSSFTLEPSMVLPVLYQWLLLHGVHIEKRKLSSLDELQMECDIVVNCSGLGSYHLVGDTCLFPVSGHVLRVEAPTVKRVLCDSREETWAYIIPNKKNVVLGSVDTQENWNTEPHEHEKKEILKRCSLLCPAVQVQTVRQNPAPPPT